MSDKHKILIVDDEISMREFLEVLLVKEGYAVTSAKNGKQALKMIQKKNYDLILSDIRLGDITGLEVLKENSICKHRTNRYHLDDKAGRDNIIPVKIFAILFDDG